MRLRLLIIVICALCATAGAGEATSQPVRPGIPGVRPFWNGHAQRFIYAPAFDFPVVAGAKRYRFTVVEGQGRAQVFDAEQPTAALSPVWEDVGEGFVTLDVQGVGADGKAIGDPARRTFYRSPGFSGGVATTNSDAYRRGGMKGLQAIFEAPHVQAWLKAPMPDRSYARYCYPNKVIGGLARAMSACSKIAPNAKTEAEALEIAKRSADYLLSIRLPASSPYANCPPTYALNVDQPTKVTPSRVADHWLMVPSAIDAAFGFLDVYRVTKDPKYLDTAKQVADAFVRTQEKDGTWPLMVDDRTGAAVSPQRLIPTWVIFFFDRLDHEHHLEQYRPARERAWKWIVENPLNTYQWDAQFEDIKLPAPYVNLAREQACDVAVLLMSGEKPSAEDLSQAEELLRFAEDQFVEWAPVRDVAGWKKAMPNRRKNCEAWITPCVLEQYACYDPVARSSAILIKAYKRAAQVTGKPLYLSKAKALANGMLAGQAWLAKEYAGNGEIPTWNMKRPPINWLNNSYYAAEALVELGEE